MFSLSPSPLGTDEVCDTDSQPEGPQPEEPQPGGAWPELPVAVSVAVSAVGRLAGSEAGSISTRIAAWVEVAAAGASLAIAGAAWAAVFWSPLAFLGGRGSTTTRRTPRTKENTTTNKKNRRGGKNFSWASFLGGGVARSRSDMISD